MRDDASRAAGHAAPRWLPRLRTWAIAATAVSSLSLTACGGMLDPHGTNADLVAGLWWVMFVLAALVFLLVLAVLFVGLLRSRRASAPVRARTSTTDRLFVFGGGILLPVGVMVLLMLLSASVARRIIASGDQYALTVDITGHQWWWELRYPDSNFTTANEVHIPVGEPVRLRLTSNDVIHSFWVPQLAGKIDLIPGRTNTYTIEASDAGTYRGQCAEFCGLEHAKMQFLVIAQPPAEFARWLHDQQGEAARPDATQDPHAFSGQQAFVSLACAGCHTIRGTAAAGHIGPDLTHVASRSTIAAGVLTNNRGNLAGWILDPQATKPGTAMPALPLSNEQAADLLAYLTELR